MFLKRLINKKVFVFLCIAFLMTSLLRYEAQANPLTSSLSVNPNAADAPDAVLTHTTVDDFDQACATQSNSHISEKLEGSVELAGEFSDTFDGSTLNSSLWISGPWSGETYTPVVNGGKVVLPPGGFVRSNTATFTRGVLEGKIEFTQGAWQHVGFASAEFQFDNKFLFFSTFNTSGVTTTLYARLGLFDQFYNIEIGSFPTGTHRYRIELLAVDAIQDRVDFYLDGASVYSSDPFTNTIMGNLNLWLSNNGTQNLTVEEIQVAPPYATSGSYISCPLDASAGMAWQTASWVSALPAGTSLTVQTHTSPDGSTWTDWSTLPTSGSSVASPDRFIQYQILLSTSVANNTGALDSISLTYVTPTADLSLTKIVSKSNPDVGSTVDFTVTVNNAGPQAASGVVVSDPLQNGYTFSGATATLGTYNNSTGLWTVGEAIPAGGNAVLTIHAVVNAAGIYSNAAEVSASNLTDPDSTPGNGPNAEDDYATLTTTPVPVADLELSKVAQSAAPLVGTTQVFTVTVTNKGPSPATGVEVIDLLNAGYQFSSATPSQGGYVQGTGVWTVGTLALNQTETLRINATVNETGPYNNYAQVSASPVKDPDSTPNDNSTNQDDDASVTVTPLNGADLSITKLAQIDTPPLYVGNTFSFRVTVTNSGPRDATGVVVKDLLPSGYQFVSYLATHGTYDAQTGLWNVGTLLVNEDGLLTITVQANVSGNYQNIAEVWQSQVIDLDSSPGNSVSTEDDYGTVTLSPLPVADLSITKTLVTAQPTVGKDIVFQIRVTNSGPSGTESVTIMDPIPPNHQFISSDHLAENIGGLISWNLGTLTASQEVTILVTLRPNSSGDYTNMVQVMTSSTHDPDSQPGNTIAGEDDQASLDYAVKRYVYLPFLSNNP